MRSIEDANMSFTKMKDILSSYVDISKAEPPEVRNIVASSNYRSDIDLSKFYVWLISSGYDAIYEPESFPGLILKTNDTTFNIFQSGKFLILGCTCEESIQTSEEFLVRILDELSSF